MEVKIKEKKLQQDLQIRMANALYKIFEKLEAPGILQGMMASYAEGELDLEILVDSLEKITSNERIKDIVPVFNDRLEPDHVINPEYGYLAEYKPLFDSDQHLVGFVPPWVYKGEGKI